MGSNLSEDKQSNALSWEATKASQEDENYVRVEEDKQSNGLPWEAVKASQEDNIYSLINQQSTANDVYAILGF